MSESRATDPQPQPPPQEGDGPVIARQAIVDAAGAVWAYELFNGSRPASTPDAASDARLLFNVLSHADTGALIDHRTVFLKCTSTSLSSGHLELVRPERIVLEIAPVAGNYAQEIERRLPSLLEARGRGFRLAFSHSVLTTAYLPWLSLADFIKVDLQLVKPEFVEPTVRLAQKKSNARLIAEKVETAAQHQRLAALGVQLFQGFWFAQPVVVAGQTIRPAQAVIIGMINLVRNQASTAEIEDAFQRDASLSFNLLRFINSSGFGLRVEITSFRQAVMLLGLKKLFRWSALLLTTLRSDGLPPAVGVTAIVRGRLMELLAVELLPPEEHDNAFVTGVCSLLDAMLGVPMDKALAAISLPETVVLALMLRQGPLAPLLQIAESCESGDDEKFAQLATQLKLSNQQVNRAHLQALSWAESIGE